MNNLFNWLTPRRFASTLIFAALLLLCGGFLNHWLLINLEPNGSLWGELLEQTYGNLSAELLGIGITVLVIDALYERANRNRTNELLVSEFSSRANVVAVRATERLWAEGLLADGS